MGPGASKINENGAQERPKSTKMVPRSVQNRPKWCPGALRKQFRKQVDFRTLPGGARTGAYNGPWAPLGRFWGPSWSPAGCQGALKSTILAPSRDKSRQNEVQEGVLKKASNFDRILIGKWEAWRPQIVDFTAVLQCYLRIHSFSKKLKIHENLCQNGPQK